MLRDRGAIKWTAMMLPEHVRKIRDWKNESFSESPRELYEWDYEDIQKTIDVALNQGKEITLSIWEEKRYVDVTGYIKSLDYNKNEIVIGNITKTKRIPIGLIHAAHLDNEYYD